MPARILVIDPSPIISETLKLRLPEEDVSFGTAVKAAELDSLLEKEWDLVITEWSLPDLEHGELMKKIDPASRAVILFTDDYDAASDEKTWRALGVKGAFSKLKRVDLIQELKRFVRGAGGGIKRKFLVVEDSKTVRSYLKRVLHDQFPGSDIYESSDGRTALRELGNQRMDLIVTDLKMPGMDGESFLNVLKSNPILKTKPVLVFSGAITESARENIQSMDKAALLAKPAEPERIAQSIHSLLDPAA